MNRARLDDIQEIQKLLQGKQYLRTLKDVIAPGNVVVHNTVVPPTRRMGVRGFRAWQCRPNKRLVICKCGWAPELGTHYRVCGAGFAFKGRSV